MTPVIRQTAQTYAAPVSDPRGRHFRGTWAAESRDGRWRYQRHEDDLPPWTVEYVPTGQTARFTGLDAAREATAGPLLEQLRGEAFTAAFRGQTDDVRRAGQRWLAVHMRLFGHTDITADCACGGLVTVALSDGTYAHVDACAKCRDTLPEDCPHADEHRFCARPDPQLSELEQRILAFERRWWRRPGAKATALRDEFPELTEIRYYAALNALLDKPAALRAAPELVRRRRRQRTTPGGTATSLT